MICPVCKSECPDGAMFCGNCGEMLKGKAAAPDYSSWASPSKPEHSPETHSRPEENRTRFDEQFRSSQQAFGGGGRPAAPQYGYSVQEDLGQINKKAKKNGRLAAAVIAFTVIMIAAAAVFTAVTMINVFSSTPEHIVSDFERAVQTRDTGKLENDLMDEDRRRLSGISMKDVLGFETDGSEVKCELTDVETVSHGTPQLLSYAETLLNFYPSVENVNNISERRILKVGMTVTAKNGTPAVKPIVLYLDTVNVKGEWKLISVSSNKESFFK